MIYLNKNKIFAIFILFALLITCAGVSFASSDFDDSLDDSDFDDYLDEDLDDDLYDESDDLYDDLYDESEDDLDDDSEDDWDDEDLDDDSDEDWDDEDLDDEDWDDDSDEDWDDEDWDDDSDEDWDDEDWDDDEDWYLDDEDWEDWDEDWNYGYIDWYEDFYYDNLDWEEWYMENNTNYNYTLVNSTYPIKLLKKDLYNRNTTKYYYLTYKTCNALGYGYAASGYDACESDNSTDCNDTYESDEMAYHYYFLATSMPMDDVNAVSSFACYSAAKSIDFADLKETFVASEAQTNRTDDSSINDIEEVSIAESFQEDNILALLALIILCLITIL